MECFKEKVSINRTNVLQQVAFECDSKSLGIYDVIPTTKV
jgi:hypothetical protein